MKVQIVLHGCDDSTYFEMEINNKELDFLERLSMLSKETSEYSCMPILDYKVEKEG